jgi:hypothetical protein
MSFSRHQQAEYGAHGIMAHHADGIQEDLRIPETETEAIQTA